VLVPYLVRRNGSIPPGDDTTFYLLRKTGVGKKRRTSRSAAEAKGIVRKDDHRTLFGDIRHFRRQTEADDRVKKQGHREQWNYDRGIIS